MSDPILVSLELILGQIANVQHQLEQTILRRITLVPYEVKDTTQGLARKSLPVDKDAAWGKGEVRIIRVPLTIECLDAVKHLYAIEELSALESLKVSLQATLDSLKAIALREQAEET